jgi:virginiamycin B lyase
MHTVGRSRRSAAIVLGALGALALLLVAGQAQAQQKKLKVSVQTSSQTQAQNQGQLQVKYNAKGLDKLTATAKATPSEGGQINFAAKATKNNPKKGTLRLPLTNAGEAALAECTSLTVRVTAKGKPSKNANASRRLSEDDPVCAEPVREFETESSISYPTGIDAGPDGALWFAHMGAGVNSLGRMTTDGEYSNFHIPVPTAHQPNDQYGHSIGDVVEGSDGAIWATPLDQAGAATRVIRRIDPATGQVTDFDLGLSTGTVGGLKATTGPDGAVWVTGDEFGGEGPSGRLFRVSTSGEVAEYPLADPDFPEIEIHPYAVAGGGDGALWFTTPHGGATGQAAAIGRFDPATEETELFPLDNPSQLPGMMTVDRAGRLWFTRSWGNSIGRVDPSSGQIVEFEIPTPDSRPIGITFADDGSLWFTEQNADNIGRYDPASGAFTEYPLETRGSLPFDIVEGPDGNIYFTEMGTGRIGQLDPAKAPAGPPNPSDGSSLPPFGEEGRCDNPAIDFLCQQQTNIAGSTFRIGDALTQELPPDTLKLTAGVNLDMLFNGGPLIPPASGPMLEARPLDVEVGGQAAVTRIGLAARPFFHPLAGGIHVEVPIDLYVSPVGSTEGGCVIGPVVQDLEQVLDEEGDFGAPLIGDQIMQGPENDNPVFMWTGTLADDAFEVPAARGCGALTPVINALLELPSPSGQNETRLPFAMFLTSPQG